MCKAPNFVLPQQTQKYLRGLPLVAPGGDCHLLVRLSPMFINLTSTTPRSTSIPCRHDDLSELP